jgi:pyruvate kinase
MKNQEKKIFVTLGPSTLNKKFLEFAKNEKISFLRLNMSHIKIKNLQKTINFIKKHNNKTPICIDTEGAQIRTKFEKKIFYNKKDKLKIHRNKGNFCLYPDEIFYKLKVNDILLIGFENLSVQIKKIEKDYITTNVITSGFLEGNKGVHVKNRNIKLNFLTEKDYEAIEIGKKNNIKTFALSFTNSSNDIISFKKILKKEKKIYKLETISAMRDLKKIIKEGENFLIDRGDLSKETEIEKIPIYQRKIIKLVKFYKDKEVYVATNLLESMIENSLPTRAEANDIFNCLELGSSGLVLAAETAIGKYPSDAVKFLKKMIKEFNNYNKKK